MWNLGVLLQVVTALQRAKIDIVDSTDENSSWKKKETIKQFGKFFPD